MMVRVEYLQWVSAGFAFLAAALWLWSARVRLPKAIEHVDLLAGEGTM
jgi:hypothetical protein